jgi:hypothetical protein
MRSISLSKNSNSTVLRVWVRILGRLKRAKAPVSGSADTVGDVRKL